MTEQEAITKLTQEGFKNVKVVHMEPNANMGQHTHAENTVHIIIKGELFITDEDGTKEYEKGDRVEFMADTVHTAAVSNEPFIMVVGTR